MMGEGLAMKRRDVAPNFERTAVDVNHHRAEFVLNSQRLLRRTNRQVQASELIILRQLLPRKKAANRFNLIILRSRRTCSAILCKVPGI